MTGIQNLVTIIQSCVCGSGNPCNHQCSSEYCVDGTVLVSGDSCDTCLSNALGTGGQCESQVNTQCAADSDCSAYLGCANQCP